MVENHQPARIGPLTCRYTVRFPAPHTHYAELEAWFPTRGEALLELFLPVWTPGSYLIREYARHIEKVEAGGTPVAKVRKNRWRVEAGGAPEIRVTWRIYCREMSVRTNWVEDSYAFLNGASTFLSPVDTAGLQYEVRLELPRSWQMSASGLDQIGEHCFIAPDFDTLVDSPIYAGTGSSYAFEIDGVLHLLVNHGEEAVWDGLAAAAGVEKILRCQKQMWGGLPYRRYVILNLLTEARGGLEHKNSMVLMASRSGTRFPDKFRHWLELVSHEFFHVWNVKRLRPVELGPFDYESENYTTSLWFAEGVTEYYGHLIVHRAGLSTRTEYLAELSEAIHSLQTTPGRLVTPVSQASNDAWIKLYRPDENTLNSTVSYYVKGAVVAWLLDARIRVATSGLQSLDDLMRLAYERYSGARGYTAGEIRSLAAEVADESLDAFFRQALDCADELDYAEALDWFGLQFRRGPAAGEAWIVDARSGEARIGGAWLGAETKSEAGRLLVKRVPRGTPAFDAGLNVDDEIIALGGLRFRNDILKNFRPGERVPLIVSRREKMIELVVTLAESPADDWRLEVSPRATPAQRLHLESWLGQEIPPH